RVGEGSYPEFERSTRLEGVRHTSLLHQWAITLRGPAFREVTEEEHVRTTDGPRSKQKFGGQAKPWASTKLRSRPGGWLGSDANRSAPPEVAGDGAGRRPVRTVV